jgi:hypothetical protein
MMAARQPWFSKLSIVSRSWSWWPKDQLENSRIGDQIKISSDEADDQYGPVFAQPLFVPQPDWLKTINDATVRFAAARVAEDVVRQNMLADMLAMGYTPPTQWQRVKHWLADKRQRAADIWLILRGGDIHRNCGW